MSIALFEKVKSFVSLENGVIGLCPGITEFGQPALSDLSIDIRPWLGEHTYGFGCLFFIHKDNWKDIPEGLDLYYGDNFIFDLQLANGKQNFIITNLNFETPFAATTGDPALSRGFLEKEKIFSKRIRNSCQHRI